MTIRSITALKHCALLFGIICTASTLQAQSQSPTWARLIKGLAFGGSVAADAAGNSYYAGYYYGTITIGAVVLSAQGSADVFLAKFDPQGNPVWARSAGGSGYDVPRHIAVDAAGNSYLTGSFNGTAAFGPFAAVSAGYTDGFLAKYDAKGECAWVVTIGGRYDDGVSGVAVDAQGNSLLVGSFTDAFIMGNGQLIAPAGGSDFLAAKFSANGACLWAMQGGGAGNDGGSDASVDASGNVYVVGSFSGNVRIGSDALTSAGTEMFVAKFDSMARPLWARQTNGKASGWKIATDKSGNSTVVGTITSSSLFGTIRLESTGDNAFVARYDAKGDCLWASASGGTHYGVRGYDAAIDDRGNVIIMGGYQGKVLFGSKELISQNNLTYDLFVCKYDSLGRCLWAKSVGGPSLDYAGGITVDGNGTPVVTGTIGDGGTFGQNILTGTGAFIATLADGLLGVDDRESHHPELPSSFELGQNYPNPFNPSTTISFSIPSRVFVSLNMYDVMGRDVATLVSEELSAGMYTRRWNAASMPSGVYYYRLQAGAHSKTKRLSVLK